MIIKIIKFIISILHRGYNTLKRLAGFFLNMLSLLFWNFISLFSKKGKPPPIKNLEHAGSATVVDSFWNIHTVIGSELDRVKTAHQSKKYLEWRFSVYPLFKDFMQLWGNHDNQVVLDYGCGPGNDLVGFLVYTRAKRVIGVDISEKALRFASKRLALHNIDNERVELIRISDNAAKIPIEDNTIDYVYCEGVLHHTTAPEEIIKEFNRVLKPRGQACIMVYNNDSIWFHLYVAYEQMILQDRFPGLNVYQAFEKTTDTEECPVARCYKPQEFIDICEKAGFRAEYVGGYFSLLELELLKKYHQAALSDERLGIEHKDFLKNLVLDEKGFPQYKGKHTGIGGVYNLYKAG